MIQISKLRGIIAMKGLSQRKLAYKMDITDKTFYAKMKKGVFNSNEIERMIEILEIENPCDIFFTLKSLNK